MATGRRLMRNPPARNALHDRTAIVGVGHTGCSKDAGVAPQVLWLRAITEAVEDAGLTVQDIDGISTPFTDTRPAEAVPTPFNLTEALGLPGLRWHSGPLGGAYLLGSVAAAVQAVATGQCTTALAVHAMQRPKQRGPVAYNYRGAQQASGVIAYLAPYGYSVFVQLMASVYSRMRAVHGITREQVGRLVVDQRANALKNPLAVMRTPLTLDEYLQARWLAEPLCLYDADMPVDASVAVIVTSAERAADLRRRPVLVANVATMLGPRPDWVFQADYTELFPRELGAEFWDRAGIRPDDLSFAQIQDGFSVYVPLWLEALGIVGRGEAGAFIGDGNLACTGSLPTNTHGGNLSEGRLQGGGAVVEAVRQLRGEAGDRQVHQADAGLVTVGGSPTVCAAVLHV
jgi:acetyl-CoA acetyltransferase